MMVNLAFSLELTLLRLLGPCLSISSLFYGTDLPYSNSSFTAESNSRISSFVGVFSLYSLLYYLWLKNVAANKNRRVKTFQPRTRRYPMIIPLFGSAY